LVRRTGVDGADIEFDYNVDLISSSKRVLEKASESDVDFINSYSYDKKGRLTNITGPDDKTMLNFEYTNSREESCSGCGHSPYINKVKLPDDTEYNLVYNQLGGMRKIRKPDYKDIIYNYNDYNYLSEIVYDDDAIDYTYLTGDNQIGIIDSIETDFSKYKYYHSTDGLNQLEELNIYYEKDTDDQHREDIEYSYDTGGRVTVKTDWNMLNSFLI